MPNRTSEAVKVHPRGGLGAHKGAVSYPHAVFDRRSLEAHGFTGFVTFDDLRESWLDYVPKTGGVYAVLRVSEQPPAYLTSNPGGRFKERDPSVVVAVLEAKWVASCSVVYVGKGDNLQRRLMQYARFGAGEPVGHWGGRYIWQLEDSAELLVAWKRCVEGQTAAELEREIIGQFKEPYDCLPFANISDPS
jgi:hypothetical protein